MDSDQRTWHGAKIYHVAAASLLQRRRGRPAWHGLMGPVPKQYLDSYGAAKTVVVAPQHH